MSEYWKSIPKYWCKHCKDFATDTPLGRKNHDATAKHQSALKRFLRDLHRDNERATQTAESAKREVARLNALVGGSGAASSSAAAAAPAPAVAKPDQPKGTRWGVAARELTADERARQMKELAALGVAMPDEFRGDLAIPGEWTTVSVEQARRPLTEKERLAADAAEEAQKLRDADERARKWQELDEDDRQVRGFKIQTRTYPGADAGDAEVDLAALLGKRKAAEPARDAPVNFAVKKEAGYNPAEHGNVKPEDGIKSEDGIKTEGGVDTEGVNTEDGVRIKTEDGIKVEDLKTEDVKTEDVVKSEDTVKREREESPSGIREEVAAPVKTEVLFKKRKVKTMRKKD